MGSMLLRNTQPSIQVMGTKSLVNTALCPLFLLAMSDYMLHSAPFKILVQNQHFEHKELTHSITKEVLAISELHRCQIFQPGISGVFHGPCPGLGPLNHSGAPIWRPCLKASSTFNFLNLNGLCSERSKSCLKPP